MTRYVHNKKKRSGGFMKFFAIAFSVLLIVTVIAGRSIYKRNLEPVSLSQHTVALTIEPGSSVNDIARLLEEKGLIRSSWAFEWYVRNLNPQGGLQAGTYSLRPSMGVVEIVKQMSQGEVDRDLFTILPGQRLDQIRNALIKGGYSEAEVDEALKPEQYADEPALADKPLFANLEGYLYPDSYERTADTNVKDLIRASLNEMNRHLTEDIKQGIKAQGLTIHEGITLASIVNQEVGDGDDRRTVAQVFLSRLESDMALQSDVTVIYGALKDGKPASLTHDSEYNTFNNKGLPPGPISNVNDSALQAVARPANTDYLYFVAGDDGKTYFSRTVEEHERLVEQHCKKLCNIDF